MDTELDFAVDVCAGVMDVWQPGPGREIILNLPCTVERSTPNVYADQIEWMAGTCPTGSTSACPCTPTTTAARPSPTPSWPVLAGADRIEGCLFGNGERTGNVCLVTLGLNLFSQGIDPMISDIDEVADVGVDRLPVHRRHRRPGLHRVLRVAPGRDQEGLRGTGGRGPAGPLRGLPVGGPVPAG